MDQFRRIGIVLLSCSFSIMDKTLCQRNYRLDKHTLLYIIDIVPESEEYIKNGVFKIGIANTEAIPSGAGYVFLSHWGSEMYVSEFLRLVEDLKQLEDGKMYFFSPFMKLLDKYGLAKHGHYGIILEEEDGDDETYSDMDDADCADIQHNMVADLAQLVENIELTQSMDDDWEAAAVEEPKAVLLQHPDWDDKFVGKLS